MRSLFDLTTIIQPGRWETINLRSINYSTRARNTSV